MSDLLKPEDYLEAECPLCEPVPGTERAGVTPVPVDRVIAKLDEYLLKNDTEGAQKHLAYWLSEAEAGNDLRGMLTVETERMGLFRKLGRKEEAIAAAEHVLSLVVRTGLENTLTDATACVNAGTVFKAFGNAQRAVELYEHARQRYELLLDKNDTRLAALYNNMGVALTETKNFAEGRRLLVGAVKILMKTQGGQTEQAISWLNLATLAEAEKGLATAEEEIEGYLSSAERLLNTPGLAHDAAYANACETCASVFDYYGRFAAAKELRQRAEKIYGRS